MPKPQPPFGLPVDPPNHHVGPGPLSPSWPKPPAPPLPPRNAWDGLANEFLALRGALLASLHDTRGTAPLMLSLDERAELEAKFARLKAGNDALPSGTRSSEVEGWPTPVLPTTILYGARDIAAVLRTAIFVAHTLASHTGQSRAEQEAGIQRLRAEYAQADAALSVSQSKSSESLIQNAVPPTESTPSPLIPSLSRDEGNDRNDTSPTTAPLTLKLSKPEPATAPLIPSLSRDEGEGHEGNEPDHDHRPLFELDIPTTATRIVNLYEAADPALAALTAAIARNATRRPYDPVPAGVVAEAARLLFDVRKIVSREPVFRGRLELGPAPDWASLAAKLAFARAALNRFHARYYEVDIQTLTGFWRTPGAADFLAGLDDT